MNTTCPQQSSRERTRMRGERKATLICPTCGHESPADIDGDWAITEVSADDVQRLAYDCPVCWTSVVVQPRFESR